MEINKSLAVGGVEIKRDERARYSLTDLHRASGQGDSKKPAQWLRMKSTKELIREHGGVVGIHTTRTHGTFAPPLLAVAFAAWISPRFHLQVNRVFLEAQAANPPPPGLPETMEETLQLARVFSDALVELAPKAAALDRIASTTDSAMTITAAAKLLQLPPKKLFGLLEEKKWIYRTGRRWTGTQTRLNQKLLEEKITKIRVGYDGFYRDVASVLLTQKGIGRLAQELEGAR